MGEHVDIQVKSCIEWLQGTSSFFKIPLEFALTRYLLSR